MSTGKTTLFYSFLIMVASLAVGMVIASRLDLTPASAAQTAVGTAPPMNSAPLSGPVDASTFRNVAKAMSPAVVNIRSTSKQRAQEMTEFFGGGGGNDDLLERFFGGGQNRQRPQRPREQETQAAGTGFVINKSLGYILTNNHVVQDATKVEVNFLGEETDVYHEAKIIGRDPAVDLALLKVEPAQPVAFIPLDKPSPNMLGQTMVVLGNPRGVGTSISRGVLSGRGRTAGASLDRVYENLLQTDAAINPGNSGGPILDIAGQLSGVTQLGWRGADGINYAIPVTTVRDKVAEFLQQK